MKKNLQFSFIVTSLIISCALLSCKKAVGPKGDPGINGNANVTQITFGSRTIATLSDTHFTLPGITSAIYEKSVILCYGLTQGIWYPLPGPSYINAHTYRAAMEPGNPDLQYKLAMIAGTSSETFNQFRFLIIPANVFVTAKNTALPFDVNDYESVRKYFNLSY